MWKSYKVCRCNLSCALIVYLFFNAFHDILRNKFIVEHNTTMLYKFKMFVQSAASILKTQAKFKFNSEKFPQIQSEMVIDNSKVSNAFLKLNLISRKFWFRQAFKLFHSLCPPTFWFIRPTMFLTNFKLNNLIPKFKFLSTPTTNSEIDPFWFKYYSQVSNQFKFKRLQISSNNFKHCNFTSIPIWNHSFRYLY